TEDHDFPEINHCHFPGTDGSAVRLAVGESASGPPEAARISVKHRILGDDVAQQLHCLDEQLGSFPGASDFLGLLRRHYQSGRPMSEAFVFPLASLFSDEGLVFLDPRTEAVARLAAPVHRKAVFEAEPLAARLLQRCRELAESDFDAQ